MPLIRKRRAEQQADEASEASPASSPEPAQQRRRLSRDEDIGYGSDGSNQERSDPQEQMVKKLVRLALACEYNRRPIRRADISEKVLGTGAGGKTFKTVFQAAQHELRTVFGMEMIELPSREKVTLQQKRAAAKSQTQSHANKTVTSWILASILPKPFRINPDILPPPAAPTNTDDSKYTSIYTLLVSLILLSGGQLPDVKLDRYLRRLGIDDATPVHGHEKTEKLIKRMERDGYVVKVKEPTGSGEDDIFWFVGPRGKVEIGENGVKGLVKAVYNADQEGQEDEELRRRINRSLGLSDLAPRDEQSNAQPKEKVRSKSGPHTDDDGDDEEGDDEDNDEQ